MTECLELYRCEICGNIVQVMHKGADALVCCGKPMDKLIQHGIEEEKQEKHVPVFLNEREIQVGSEPHPMLEEHHIEFIQAVSDDKKHVYTKFLDIADEPKMKLNNDYKQAIEYCNIHGLWGSK
ncbi:desulfoferrodoxin FeS4 iron-binding domain-containing protein [bacterium]|nr:desulfoferrodoxin FeS4 iron-binding domain-containing protein [bacterium]